MQELWGKIFALFVAISINIEIIVTKPTETGQDRPVTTSTNFRCVEINECRNPIIPNPSNGEVTRLPPDLALYDDDGYPIWTMSFCKHACRNDDQNTIDEEVNSGVRSGNFGNLNVCCGEKDLTLEAKNKRNWSLTKDPNKCKESEKDGYRCVPESKCTDDGYSEESDIGNTEVWECAKPEKDVGVRHFQDEERKKSNGNVCCRVKERVTERLDYDDYPVNEENICTQREGYSCVSSSLCRTETSNALSSAIHPRGDGPTDEWAASAICESPRDDVYTDADEDEAFVRSDRGRRQAQANENVCCHETNIRPPCSDISETHRCVELDRCSPIRRRQEAEIQTAPSVRSGGSFNGGDVHPSERLCSSPSSDRTRMGFTASDNTGDDYRELISERRDGRDYDIPRDGAYDDYDGYDTNNDDAPRDSNNYDYPNYDDDEPQICCDHRDIIPEIVEETDIQSCDDKFGFKCIPQEKCRNSQILITRSDDDENERLVKFGIRVDKGQTVLSQKGNLCGSVLEVCCNTDKLPKSEDLKNDIAEPTGDYISKCGSRNIKGVDVRVDGKEDGKQLTQFGEWPNMCAISMLNSQTGRRSYLGGASLITAGIVVTAAHKVTGLDLDDINVRCGDWDVKQSIEPRPYQDRDVESISIHPAFDNKNIYNDVALLHVAEEFKLDKHIDTICLPPPNDQLAYMSRGCKATGWGKDKYEGGSYQVLMAQVELPLVSNRKCQSNLREYTALSDSFRLDESFICAGGDAGVDTCVGDGGGPLMCPSADPNSSQWIQAGITAWGIGCGKANVPGVYASMADAGCFIDWATKCKHGRKYVNDYDFTECNNDGRSTWIDEEITRLEAILDKAIFHLEQSNLSRVQKRRYEKREANTRKYIDNAKAMKAGCNDARSEAKDQGIDDEVFVRQDGEQASADDYDYDYGYDEGAVHSRD